MKLSNTALFYKNGKGESYVLVEYKESKNHYAASDSYDLCSIYYYSCVYRMLL